MREDFMLKKASIVILLFVLAATGGSFKATAANASTLKGRVINPDGAVIVGAKVRLLNPNTGRVENAITNADGAFTIYNIPHNSYVLTVEVEGFAPFTKTLDIHSDSPTDLGDIKLELATLSAAV